jgi:hypothetical protein
MTDETEALVTRLRLHAYDLVNGGTNASELQRDLRAAADALQATDGRVRQFIGWLSVDISELHAVEVPLLADSWERFKQLP